MKFEEHDVVKLNREYTVERDGVDIPEGATGHVINSNTIATFVDFIEGREGQWYILTSDLDFEKVD